MPLDHGVLGFPNSYTSHFLELSSLLWCGMSTGASLGHLLLAHT